jgi:hypothetical protein
LEEIMGSEISIRAFAKIAGVTPPGIRKAIKTGRVHEGANGLDPDDRTNALFIGTCHYKKIGEMERRGRIAPRWAAICVPFPGQHPKPVFYYAPSGETIVAGGTFFEDWGFDPDEWTAHDPSGGVHRLELVTCPDAPPPWFSEARSAGRPSARPRALPGVVKGHARPPARHLAGHQAKGARA